MEEILKIQVYYDNPTDDSDPGYRMDTSDFGFCNSACLNELIGRIVGKKPKGKIMIIPKAPKKRSVSSRARDLNRDEIEIINDCLNIKISLDTADPETAS